MTVTFERRAPVDLPGPDGDNTIAREPLWHAYGAGDDTPGPPPWAADETPPPEAHVPPPAPASVRDGESTVLPLGTVDLLAGARFPHERVADAPAGADRLWHALTAAFGVHRREPDNPFNDHRGYASPRCLFPVSVFAGAGRRWRMLDAGRHRAVALDGVERPPGSADLVLAGRYTAIPQSYQWFRGSLVNLELGIGLRALALGLDLFGLPGRLRLPDAGSAGLLASLGLAPGEWALPLTVQLGDEPQVEADRQGGSPRTRAAANASGGTDGVYASFGAGVGDAAYGTGAADLADRSLADLLRVNRAQDFAGPAAPIGSGVPDGASVPSGGPSWAELLWRRNSGRMPRGMHGMTGRRRPVPAEALAEALRWLGVPPPGDPLAAAFAEVTATVVAQGVEGFADGVHRVVDGEAVLVAEDPKAPARLEAEYGYPLTPGNGCSLRHASMIWYLSVKPRQLAAHLGEAGWTASQYACGWATHGLCLAAASAGLFARPVRAYREIPTQRILGLDQDDMIVISVVVGSPRPSGGALLDIRL